MMLQLAIPPGFIPLPITADEQQQAADSELIATLAGFGNPSPTIADALVQVARSFHDCGVIFAGQLTDPEIGPSHCALVTLSVSSLGRHVPDFGNRHSTSVEAARAIASVLSEGNPDAVVQYRDLDCGPTVLVLRAGRFVMPEDDPYADAVSGLPPTSDNLQALVPLTSTGQLLVLDMSTSSREHWPRFIGHALQMVASIRGNEDIDRSSGSARRGT
ncbi:hypothetical protein [Rhodococcus sp. HNM0569]|uniref:hypothetical protein n=1 Tax=Rhodococcus sp. HNM0569 TaxID=2716340 RepID=UPI00146AD597|nr:hypothetical protein [Rhodococcus sp. HNM0569]NLU82034.1 hypothetical protein [Rhodococcus sp. HNM0569]